MALVTSCFALFFFMIFAGITQEMAMFQLFTHPNHAPPTSRPWNFPHPMSPPLRGAPDVTVLETGSIQNSHLMGKSPCSMPKSTN